MRWVSLLFIWSIGFLAAAQTYPSTNYTDRDILPNNDVRALFIAADGALWVGTSNGLVRKFNNQITTFYKEDGLTQNNIWSLAQDATDRIWIGSYGKGLTTYKNNRLVAFHDNNKLPNQEVTNLLVHGNLLYVGTSDGIALIDLKEKKQVKSLKPIGVDGEKFIVSGFIPLDGQVYVVTYAHGIHRIDVSGKELKLEQTYSEEYLYAAYSVGDSIYLSGKEFFKKLSTSQFKSQTNLEQIPSAGNSIIWDYQKINDQMYAAAWGIYANDGGVYELTKRGMNLRNADFGIESMQVTSLAYDDKLGLLYAGTRDQGLYEIRLDQQVQFIPSTHDKTVGFSRLDTVAATLYGNGLKIGDRDINADQFKNWQVQYVKKHPKTLPKYSDHFYELKYETNAEDIIFYSIKNRLKSFWVNTSIGIYQFDPSGKLISYLPVHALEFNFTADDKLLEPNFFHGTRVYNSFQPIEYTYFDQKKTSQNPRYVVGSFQHSQKTYLTSLFNGLYAFEDGKFSSYIENRVWNESRLRYVTGYGDNSIAVSNEDGDVFIINDGIDSFNVEKLNRNVSYGSTITFLTVYEEYLIIGTPKGVVLHNGTREIFIDREQGLNTKIYNGYVDGNLLLLASDNGSYVLKLTDIINGNNLLKNIRVESILVNGVFREWKHSDNLKLASNENSLEIQLGTNKIPYPGKLGYSYRFNTSQDWMPLEDGILNLQLLESGKYELFLKVTDASSGMMLEQKALNFSIATPFYKSIWFTILCFITALGSIVLYILIRWKKAERIALEKEASIKRIEEVKMEALLSQMNPHFIFNSLNSVQYLISNSENEKAMRYLGTFSDLMRANLNNTSKPFLSLEEEIAYLKKYIALENARFSDRIQVTFLVDPELSVTQTSIPTMILQPFIENAFVHAFPERVGSPQLEIAFAKIDSHQYRCIIQDNGIGKASFSQNRHHISKGTQLVKERLSYLGYNLQTALIVKYSSMGTTVRLLLEQ